MHILLLPVTPHTVWTVDVPYFSIWQTLTPAPPLPTGYLQKQLANGTLSLPSPGAVNVTLRISSGWDAANPYVPVTIPVTLNPGSGSFQAEVAVPPSISMGTYTVSIMVRSLQMCVCSHFSPCIPQVHLPPCLCRGADLLEV